MDPRIARVWLIARVCEAFKCLPLEAKRELESDPEHLAELIPMLWSYARLRHIFKTSDGKKEALKPYQDSRLMSLVMENTMRLHKERVARRRNAPKRKRTKRKA